MAVYTERSKVKGAQNLATHNGITTYGNRKTQIISALTQWDVKQSQSKRAHHNPYFLGIALQAFDDVDGNEIEANPREFIIENFTGACRRFVIKALGLEPLTDREDR